MAQADQLIQAKAAKLSKGLQQQAVPANVAEKVHKGQLTNGEVYLRQYRDPIPQGDGTTVQAALYVKVTVTGTDGEDAHVFCRLTDSVKQQLRAGLPVTVEVRRNQPIKNRQTGEIRHVTFAGIIPDNGQQQGQQQQTAQSQPQQADLSSILNP